MIRLDKVSKVFGTGVAGLSDISLLVDKGEFVFLVGHTGSGKTTLLRLLVRETLPTSGTIVVSDFDVVKLPANKIPHLRKKVGVVFQDLKLLMDRTILENIVLPMQVAGMQVIEAVKRAEELLQMVGLIDHKDKFPVQLSGGELQRVAIARALALSPEILLADEPTGNLDPQTAQEIVALLKKINEMGTTIVMATHNLEIVQKMNKRVIGLEKGKLVKDDRKGHAKAAPEKHEEPKEEVASTPKPDEVKAEDTPKEPTIEQHKKETKRLSDLLAKARLTLHKHEEKKDSSMEIVGEKEKSEEVAKKKDMPFGFSKDEDVAKKDTEKPAEETEEKI